MFDNPIPDIRKKLNQAIATGINQTASELMDDLRENVPIKTNLLNPSYRQTVTATPAKFEAVVESPVFYSPFQYPQRFNYKSRPPASSKLFKSLTGAIGVLKPSEVDNGGLYKALKKNVELAIQQALS